MILLDARVGAVTSWPVGAHRADLEHDLSAPNDPSHGGRHPLPSLATWCATLGRWGVTPDTDVLVFDDQGGGMAAARAWWMIRAVGHERVRVALPEEAATLLSGPLTSEATPPAAGPSYPARAWTGRVVSADDVERIRQDPAWRLVDARATERFRGESEHLDPVAGHIPGAVNLPWTETVDPNDFSARWQAMAQIEPSRVVAQCGSGVTACHTLLQLHRLGLDGAALYVGSYSEWCRQGRPTSDVE